MSNEDSTVISKRLELLGLEVIGGSLFLLVLVVFLWASNEGSNLQSIFLWMAIISVVLSIAGVQVLLDTKKLSATK